MSFPISAAKAVAGVLAPAALAAIAFFVTPHFGKVVSDIRKHWAGKHIVILGRQQVGKTTLLRAFLGGDLPTASTATDDPSSGGMFELEGSGKVIRFRVRHDQPGWAPDNAYKGWKEDFDRADFVLYLFRADLIERGDKKTVALVEEDLNQFKTWLPKGKSKKSAPKVILIGTWADKSVSLKKAGMSLESIIRNARPIKLGAVKLNKADLVVGSLITEEERETLITRLRKYVT